MTLMIMIGQQTSVGLSRSLLDDLVDHALIEEKQQNEQSTLVRSSLARMTSCLWPTETDENMQWQVSETNIFCCNLQLRLSLTVCHLHILLRLVSFIISININIIEKTSFNKWESKPKTNNHIRTDLEEFGGVFGSFLHCYKCMNNVCVGGARWLMPAKQQHRKQVKVWWQRVWPGVGRCDFWLLHDYCSAGADP